jgi:Predicted amidophosphoribosyltransferases
VALWSYAFPFDRLLLAGKYHAEFPALAWCAQRAAVRRQDFLAERLTVIPVPLAPERLAERGYNQAEEIARVLLRDSLWAGDRLDTEAVLRLRATAPQQGLDWRTRRANVRGAFAATRSLTGEVVLLVDDVLTTGATLNELARVLRAAGADAVDALVLARVLPPKRREGLSRMQRSVV